MFVMFVNAPRFFSKAYRLVVTKDQGIYRLVVAKDQGIDSVGNLPRYHWSVESSGGMLVFSTAAPPLEALNP